MKKFKILLLLISIPILLTSCGSLNDVYGEKYGDDWLASTNK